MKYELLDEGFALDCSDGRPDNLAATARCALTDSGDVVCTAAVTSGLGMNDFAPYLVLSTDMGVTWKTQGFLFGHLRGRYSINSSSISCGGNGELLVFGSRTPIGEPGESFWCPETQGILENELAWSRSVDEGRTWGDPQIFPVPSREAAEVCAPLCQMRSGRWLGPYAPHNTFEPELKVDREHIVVMYTDDRGRTWNNSSTLRVATPDTVSAGAWVTELIDGTLLATCAMLNLAAGPDHPAAYALSHDGGTTWTDTRSTALEGQTNASAVLPDGRVLFVYSRRHYDPRGIWLAVARPSEKDFNVEANEPVWLPEKPTHSDTSGKLDDWTDFAFGEPAVSSLPDNTVLVTLWCAQPSGKGIRFVKLAL